VALIASDILFEGCDFISNDADLGGGACFLDRYQTQSPVTFDGCNAFFRSCTFHDNEALQAGAMEIDAGSPTIVKCSFTENRATSSSELTGGGAIKYYGHPPEGHGTSLVTIYNTDFLENHAHNLGGAIFSSKSQGLLMMNGLLALNTCGGNGAAIHYFGDPETAGMIVNTTIADNHASGATGQPTIPGVNGETGGIYTDQYVESGSLFIKNSILWGNTDESSGTDTEEAQLQNVVADAIDVTYSCVQDLSQFAGTGNIGADPEFQAGGYHLQGDSP